MSRWICIPCVTPYATGEQVHDGVVTCEADTAEQAAAIAHEAIYAESPDTDTDYTGSMFVLAYAEGDFAALRRRASFERAADEWQCCAGPIEFTNNGHSGYCPKAAPDG